MKPYLKLLGLAASAFILMGCSFNGEVVEPVEEVVIIKEIEPKQKRAAYAQAEIKKREEYKDTIAQHVMRYWRRPSSAVEGLSCTVKIKQVKGGKVVSAKVGICNGDRVVQRSIEHAVLRASPLPSPPDPELFDRNLIFTFKPRD